MGEANKWNLNMVRNIGISAHIDSGKTTLTERILFYGGKIHAMHDVRGKDGVGAKMDSMDLEKERGITIKSAATNLSWNDANINILDTPGHVDFTIEVERSLRILDGAILVLCGVAGVQPQSITVDRQMRRYNVPRIAFINKLDRTGADPYKVTTALREKLHLNAHMIQIPIGLENDHEGVVDLVEMRAVYFDGIFGEIVRYDSIPENLLEQAQRMRMDLISVVADFDDVVGEKYLLEQDISPDELRQAIRAGTLSLKFCPVLMGSAFKNKGVQEVLDGVKYYLPSPQEVENRAYDQANDEAEIILETDVTKPLVALAFKLEETTFGQLTYVRIYQGTLRKGDFIYNISDKGKKVKVPRLVRMHSNEMQEIEEAYAGDIVALFGVSCSSGNTFTDNKVECTMSSMYVPNPVVSLAISPKNKISADKFSKALSKFTKEDPSFHAHRDQELGEMIISGMGELHLDIYIQRMLREFDVDVLVSAPRVAYREAIRSTAEFTYEHKKQTGGSGQYAKISGYIEPLPLEMDVPFQFENKIIGGKVPKEYIPAIEKGFKEQMEKGSLVGSPIVGVKVVLTDGAYHDVDSSEMAFKLCAMAAMRSVYSKASPVVLEPIMRTEVSVPEEFQGNVIRQINQRRGMIIGSTNNDHEAIIEAEVPLVEMFGYENKLRSATQGKGKSSMEFFQYAICPANIQAELVKKHQSTMKEEE